LVSLLLGSVSAAVLPRPVTATCRPPTSPCVDAEPLWLSPSAGRFSAVSDTSATPAGAAGLALSALFRLRPAVLTVPAPSQFGRDVNVLRYANDAALGGRLGIGNRLELTLLLNAGLYQRGAGIKGVTDQSASGVTPTTRHDPRLGFGYALGSRTPRLGAKLRFEAKLPLGDAEALSGEPSFVASPSLALSSELGGFFAGAELGARLRRPTSVFGVRIGSQASIAVGAGYELRPIGLALAVELYALPSLIDSGTARYLPSEWLATLSFAPRSLARVSFGLGGGGGLPSSSDSSGSSLAFGVPSFRGLAFVRVAPAAD
jgi:hypothetical protein